MTVISRSNDPKTFRFCPQTMLHRKVPPADEKEDLCNNLNSIRLNTDAREAKAKRNMFNRHCTSCNKGVDPSRRPAVARARSASCLQKVGCQVVSKKNNGLPGAKCHVPRPRTPYARRSFCIDTLAPPFSIVNGCRDADYPEHWRLTSIYQQSYRSPVKMKDGRTLVNYDRL